MNIIIFSRPIHSGKTTQLMQWCSRQKNMYGILMPDINGSRKIMDLNTKEIFDIECRDAENTKEPITSVGKFNFYAAAFEKANFILIDALQHNPGWLVIDEAGRLELDGKGFYPAIKKITEAYLNKKQKGNLLIIARDSLCEDVIKLFNLGGCRVIHKLEELD